MNRQKFNRIVSSPDSVTLNDSKALSELAHSYPYSQVIHSLAAKSLAKSKSKESQQAINLAAMYATDRQVLKALVLSTPKQNQSTERTVTQSDKEKAVGKTTPSPKHKKITLDTKALDEDSQHVRNSIWSDLEDLKTSKENYIHFLDNEELNNKKENTKKTTREKVSTKKRVTQAKSVKKSTSNKVAGPSTKRASSPKATVKSSPTKKVAAKVSETKKKIATRPKTARKTSVTKTTKSIKVEAKSTSSNKEIKKKPSQSKTKTNIDEQIHLIDEFIDKKPSISSKPITSVEANQKDLSENSTTLGDDLISENLALILVDQGKSQKAIEMYKKLIWKFPQKKSYFAAQIEALKK